MVLVLVAYLACIAAAIVWIWLLTEKEPKAIADADTRAQQKLGEERLGKAKKRSFKQKGQVDPAPTATEAKASTNGSTLSAPVRQRVKWIYPDRLSCAPFANEDMQKLVFGFVGAKQWLVMGAVCEQWQYMYKQHVGAYRQVAVYKRYAAIPRREYNETAYSALFTSVSDCQWGLRAACSI
jgi:hypothetical protein